MENDSSGADLDAVGGQIAIFVIGLSGSVDLGGGVRVGNMKIHDSRPDPGTVSTRTHPKIIHEKDLITICGLISTKQKIDGDKNSPTDKLEFCITEKIKK